MALVEEKGQMPLTVVSQAQIENTFPVIAIQGQPQCVVCLAPVEDEGRKLHCGHTFHAQCILSWWMHRPRATLECPTCKHVQNISDQDDLSSIAGQTSLVASLEEAVAATAEGIIRGPINSRSSEGMPAMVMGRPVAEQLAAPASNWCKLVSWMCQWQSVPVQ
jgi:hypothetical protein